MVPLPRSPPTVLRSTSRFPWAKGAVLLVELKGKLNLRKKKKHWVGRRVERVKGGHADCNWG